MNAPRAKVAAAFASLYVFWGSTYLAMRFAVETIPPVFMAGVRFPLAGGMLYLFARWRGAAGVQPEHWRAGTIAGCLLMTGNACVAIATQRIPSGVASLIVAMSALWLVIFDWLRPGGRRPSAGVMAGLVMGLAGVAVLIGPARFMGGDHIDPVGAAIVIAGTLAWSAGSIYVRQAPQHPSPLIMPAIQMLTGGLFLLAMSLVTGQAAAFDPSAMSQRSLLAFAYLIVFGSLIGFTSYIYLLSVSTPARVGTYAYVNPLVAVMLGWAFAGEPITPRIILASTIIIGAVAIITAASSTGARTHRDDHARATQRATDKARAD